jgi:hypothetical protein
MTNIIANEDLREIKRLISAGKITLSELMERLAPSTEIEQIATPRPPKAVVLSDAEKTAMRTLPSKMADVLLPGEIRELTQSERDVFVPLFAKSKLVESAVKKVVEGFKEAFHNDLDAQAPVDAPLGKNGHKLVGDKDVHEDIVARDFSEKVIRYKIGGNAVELTDLDLQEMVDDGKLTKAQYQRMTRAVTTRVVVPDAVMAEIARDSAVLDAIAAKATRTDQTTGLRMAKVK